MDGWSHLAPHQVEFATSNQSEQNNNTINKHLIKMKEMEHCYGHVLGLLKGLGFLSSSAELQLTDRHSDFILNDLFGNPSSYQ